MLFNEIRNSQFELLDYAFAEGNGGGDQIVVIGTGSGQVILVVIGGF